MSTEFNKLKEHLTAEKNDANPFDGAEIEVAYMVDKVNKVVTPGINIMTDSFDLPLFISIAELREAADLAELTVKKLMEQN